MKWGDGNIYSCVFARSRWSGHLWAFPAVRLAGLHAGSPQVYTVEAVGLVGVGEERWQNTSPSHCHQPRPEPEAGPQASSRSAAHLQVRNLISVWAAWPCWCPLARDHPEHLWLNISPRGEA